MKAARRLPRDAHAPAIVFTTAFTAHALAAFEVGAVDYLLKLIEPDRLVLAMTRARAFLAGRDAGTTAIERHLWISHRGDLVRVDLTAIQRVEAERNYVRLHVEGRSHLLRETVGEHCRPTARPTVQAHPTFDDRQAGPYRRPMP